MLFSRGLIKRIYKKKDLYPNKAPYIPSNIYEKNIFVKNENRVFAQCTVFYSENNSEAMIGHFEAIDFESGKYVLSKAVKFLKEFPIKTIIGPMNGSKLSSSKFFYEGEDPTYIEPKNPKYYYEIFEGFGFYPFQNYYSYKTKSIDKILKYTEPLYQEALKNGFKFIPMIELGFSLYLEEMLKVTNLAFKDLLEDIGNLTPQIYIKAYPGIKHIVNKELSYIVKDKENHTAAFILVLDNWTENIYANAGFLQRLKFFVSKKVNLIQPKEPIMRTMGTLPKYQSHNLAWSTIYLIHEKLKNQNFKFMEYHLANENYVSHKMSLRFCEIIRTFKMYKLDIKEKD